MGDLWLKFVADFVQKNPSSVLVSILKITFLTENSEKEVTVACENQGMRMFLETRKSQLEKELSSWLGKSMIIKFIVPQKPKKNLKEAPLLLFEKKITHSLEAAVKKAGLQPRLSFENFAVSSSNQIAYAAAQAVADNAGKTYNPLFIYGGVGVGKTHMTQAIGCQTLKKDPEKKVLYCTSEEFTNDLIEVIKAKNTGYFRKKYRSLDVLLVDDIQFIAGKNYIQEELYHTFNTIIKNGGQIVLTSDRPPKEINKLEDRLRSRFSGGLTIDIQPPDLELRSAILLIKAQERNIEIDIEAAKTIAETVGDARELEGRLLTICARLADGGGKITHDAIKKELRQKITDNSARISPKDVIKTICSYYNIKNTDIKNSVRKEKVALPRQICMFVLRNHLKLKYEEIAFILKRKDHTTAIHGVEKITNLLVKNPIFKEEIDRIINSLTPST